MREIRIAINMRALRIANEYPQKYISELIHVARQTYSLYENGKGLPDLEAVCYLADFYGVSVDMLLYADLSAKQIADSTANEHFAIAPETSAIPLNGAEARMLIKVSNPHFKWGFRFYPSGDYYWFRQRRDFAVPLFLVALLCRARYFLPSSSLSFSSCS